MITVIGLGEVGIQTFKELNKKRKDIFGVDIKNEVLGKLVKEDYKVGKVIPKSEIYIIAVYLTEQVMNILKKLDYSNKPLIVIESTVMPGTYQKILQWKKDNKINVDFVLFPHRFNPNDSEHHVFNLDRAIGGEKKAVDRALKFYEMFMDKKLIHRTTPEIAELTKPMENAYRFVEIAIAEEIKLLCKEKNIDFKELRKIMNTKWNIDLKEARDGINGKCLPKDVEFVNKFFEGNKIFNYAIQVDKRYKIEYKKGV